MNSVDAIPLMLLAMMALALGIGFFMLGWLVALNRRARAAALPSVQDFFPAQTRNLPMRPECWLAIRSVSPEAVKMALGLNRATPCSWAEGIAGAHEFFISPRVHGWVIVTGVGLPNPSEDVDGCFHFLTAMSRQLGHVQYFYANRLFQHHGWARLDEGSVTRGYAWTGETVWNQGVETLPEISAGLKTFAYGENTATILDAEMNYERVPQLAARWSLDPAEVKLNSVRESTGIAGESAWS
jgi:hypothetical protein